MADQFTAGTREALARNGWTVGATQAHRSEARNGQPLVAKVHADGTWTANRRHYSIRWGIQVTTLASGTEVHPASAAADANEILWAWRDGKKVPDHLRGKLTDQGRAVL